MSALGLRRDKAAASSGCKFPPEYAKIPLKSGAIFDQVSQEFHIRSAQRSPTGMQSPLCLRCSRQSPLAYFLEERPDRLGRAVARGRHGNFHRQTAAARVIRFSSPWDFVVSDGNARRLAPGSRRPAKRRQSGGSADISSRNPFHGEGIRNPAYAEQRAFFSWPIAVAAAL
jgi:hypothetical protein